jgi:hypothetical protein
MTNETLTVLGIAFTSFTFGYLLAMVQEMKRTVAGYVDE